AVDVYTGRLLWEKEMPDVGYYYRHTGHHPGAGEIGSNYISLDDGVYVVYGDGIVRLDSASGDTLSTYTLPAKDGGSVNWGYLGAWQNLLIASSSPLSVEPLQPPKPNVHLSALTPTNGTTKQLGFRHDLSVDGEPLHIDWRRYDKGIGLRAPSELRYALKPEYRSFVAKVGVDRESGERGSVIFSVAIDGQTMDRTALLRGKEESRFHVPIPAGAKTISLIVSDGGDGPEDDRANWAMAGFVTKQKKDESPGWTTRLAAENVALTEVSGVELNTRYAASSRELVVMDRRSGDVLWHRPAAYNFRHNAIVAGAGKIFCIDGMTKDKARYLRRRGIRVPALPTLYALDARTGREIWSTDLNVFGTWLGYSIEHDALVQAGSPYRDRAADEAREGIIVYRGADGDILWQDLELDYAGPLILHHDRIITNGDRGFALELLSGKRTGFEWSRHYGCNTAIASEHLLTFRSGAAGYYDLTGDSGTGNLGGFKSSCTANLIVANGVLNAPDYTRTCTCAYQNQSSLGIIHMSDQEMWTFGGARRGGSLGINFGAPGNRRAPNGTLWLDYPSVGGEKKMEDVVVEPASASYFRHHASRIAEGELPWVGASGVRGARRITIPLTERDGAPGTFTVRYVYGAPADAPTRTLIKEFNGVRLEDKLVINVTGAEKDSAPSALCGVELVAEGKD
ncbi:NPCBM/NEW2 domain-containing protein, partial [Candidatus Sumerlaeota bacterium]